MEKRKRCGFYSWGFGFISHRGYTPRGWWPRLGSLQRAVLQGLPGWMGFKSERAKNYFPWKMRVALFPKRRWGIKKRTRCLIVTITNHCR